MLCPISGMAQEKDTNIDRAEQMFVFLLQDQADSLYENLSEKVKPMVQKQQFKGILKQLEQQAGPYQKHGSWEIQEIMGQKCYVSMVQFEKAELGALVIFDTDLKMLGIQLVPASAVKKE
jgi:tRNA A37 N6-isopentenylltransferase MiaA